MSENKILRDLSNGQNLSEALPRYAALLAEGYTKLSYSKLAVNMTTYYDDLEKAAGIDGSRIVREFKELIGLVDQLLDENSAPDKDRIAALRTEIIRSMQQKYDYVRMLGVYEHIMNRIQCRFEDAAYSPDIEILLQEITSYIHKDQEAQGMNERIQNVFGEMPVRITKSRFLDAVKDACAYYRNTRSDIADYFFDQMNQQAQVLHADQLSPDYADLYDIAHDIEALDFKNIDADQTKKADEKLQIAGQQLSASFSYDFQILELVNDLYVITLNQNKVNTDNMTVKTARRLMKAYIKAAQNKDFIGMDENILEDITKLNEDQQNMTGLHMMFEDRLLDVISKRRFDIDGLGLTEPYADLRRSNILTGIDLMAELDVDKMITIADDEYIAAKTSALLDQYRKMFEEQPMMVRRAVINDALSKLPIIFNNTEEVDQFIRQNFENCHDDAEKMASSKLIREIMNAKEWA